MFDLFFLSELLWWHFVAAFVYGVVIGSFLNVYIYRFHTGKSLSGHSHCLSCGTRLRWYELFPLGSYLALRGRCRSCGCSIPSRYFVVELGTGILFALCLLVTTSVPELLILWFICSVLMVITVYDYYHFIIPDFLSGVLLSAVVGWYGYRYLLAPGNLLALFGSDVLYALAGSGFFLFLWVISKGTWLGFGDVKLAIPLGLLVGAELVFSFVVLSFWIGAAISLSILAFAKYQRGQAGLHLSSTTLTMKSAVPFAPFLVASSLVTLFTHFNVLEFFSFI